MWRDDNLFKHNHILTPSQCDETKPSCNRCLRQGRSCSYQREPEGPAVLRAKPSPGNDSLFTNSPSPAQHGAVNFGSPTSTSTPSSTTLTVTQPGISSSAQDLELLHHWTMEAFTSFAGGPTQASFLTPVWQNAAVKQALKYPFLMHAMFSFSALHLVTTLSQDLAPSRDAWLRRSAHDYGVALTLARPELENINPHNCHAVFAFSSIVAITRMAMPAVTGDFGDGVLDHIAQTFHLLRGILAVLKVAFGWVKAGPFGPAMQDIDDFEPKPIDPDIRDALEAIEFRIPRVISDRNIRSAYYDAIQRMRLYFAHPGGAGAAVHSAAAWPVLLQAEYMDELVARNPLALCLLAYYAVMLDEQKGRWYMSDYGKRLLVAVIQELRDEEWLPFIQVAKNRVRPEIMLNMLNFKTAKTAATMLPPVEVHHDMAGVDVLHEESRDDDGAGTNTS